MAFIFAKLIGFSRIFEFLFISLILSKALAFEVEFMRRPGDDPYYYPDTHIRSALNIWSPRITANVTTLVLFSGGVTGPELMFGSGAGAGTKRAIRYDDVMRRIASEGVMVILICDMDGVAGADEPGHTQHLVWMLEEFIRSGSLVNYLEEQGAQARPDFGRLALGGHGSGTSVAVRALRDHGCLGVGGLVLLNPKDSLFEVNVGADPAVTPGTPLNFKTPTLLLSGGLDHLGWGADILREPQPLVRAIFRGCSISQLGSDRFYDASKGPIWSINATEFGYNDITSRAYDFSCPSYRYYDNLHERNWNMFRVNQATNELYHPFVAKTILSFLSGVMDGATESLEELENGDASSLVVTTRKFRLDNETHSQIKPYCLHRSYAYKLTDICPR